MASEEPQPKPAEQPRRSSSPARGPAADENKDQPDDSDATVPAPPSLKEEDSVDSREKPSRAGSVAATPAKGDAGSETGTPQYTATTTTTRRNANGSVSSVYSGNKIRHLKKEDGVPLWRKDIQYDFLKAVFEDEQRVFHKSSDGTPGHSFADIYLDAMAKSSKCSKILKDKLLSDRPAGVNMAMVCLLVNVGRMNTTLNFFPEMRAQLRTYHSIPSLQAHQDANAYKQLQDAPRLKSILKGATEDIEQPGTVEDIKAAPIPRTNPVNLIFVLAQQAPKISETHFDVPRDFFDLVMKEQLSSGSRATAFLWLMWWYLESNFTLEDALRNPYGLGRRGKDASDDELPLKCPQFEFLSEEEAALENVDSLEEREFGEAKRLERQAIINGDVMPLFSGPKRLTTKQKMFPQNPVFSVNSNMSPDDSGTPSRDIGSPVPTSGRGLKRGRASKLEHDSDSDRTRSVSPIGGLLGKASGRVRDGSRPGRGNWRRNRATADGSANGDPRRETLGGMTTVFVPISGGGGDSGPSSKRSRPPTSHQLALENFRKQRVRHILDRGLRDVRLRLDRKRRVRSSALSRAWLRIRQQYADSAGYDTDEEASVAGLGRIKAAEKGIAPVGFGRCAWERPDYGAEVAAVARSLKRVKTTVDGLDRELDGELLGEEKFGGEEMDLDEGPLEGESMAQMSDDE